jgi:hypothetical protein
MGIPSKNPLVHPETRFGHLLMRRVAAILNNRDITRGRAGMADGKMSLPVVRGYGETSRRDLWWVQPLAVFLGFSAFIVYSTWAAFQNDHYTYGNYLSPMYSPALFYGPTKAAEETDSRAVKGMKRFDEQKHHTFFGQKPDWIPLALFSPAFLILWAPGGFRFTCYYYRGAYYKAFKQDPPNCAVGEPFKGYWGEHSLPLILQNIHRYFLYLAILFILLLAYDAIQGFIFFDADGKKHFGIGVGSFVLLLNVILLGSYTFGCHSFRHLIGGRQDEISKSGTLPVYNCVSCLNRWHMACAWCSLFWVGFSDVYVRLCSMGVWTDYHIVF